ncbi:MAG: aminopeptidase P N-terminal domain-containing protein [Gemmatimonadota bacterium]
MKSVDKNLSPASPAPDGDDLAEFLDRRERISGALGDRAALILPAAPQLRFGRDGELRYRPDPELYYLTGWRDAGAVAVIDPTDSEAPYRLFVAPRDPEVERWHGPGVGPEEAGGVFGADATLPLDELESHLAKAFGRLDRAYYRMGVGEGTDRAVLAGLARNRKARQRGGVGLRAVADPGHLLDPLRRVKSVREVERIRRAARVTAEAFEEARLAIRPGAGEWQVQAPLEAGFRSRGAAGPAFETIVAGGANAVVLHYTRNSARLADGEFVLIDAGAQLDLYAADVTRTWAVGGALGGAAAEMHEIVVRAQRAAITACRPGESEQSVHDAALAVLLEGAAALGLLPEERATGGDAAEHRDIIPHRTSHWLGLEVHDVGDYATPSGPVPLEPGMVLTVEPGLYVPLDHPTAPPELRGVGVRIEDDALITEAGADVLTAALDRAAGGD